MIEQRSSHSSWNRYVQFWQIVQRLLRISQSKVEVGELEILGLYGLIVICAIGIIRRLKGKGVLTLGESQVFSDTRGIERLIGIEVRWRWIGTGTRRRRRLHQAVISRRLQTIIVRQGNWCQGILGGIPLMDQRDIVVRRGRRGQFRICILLQRLPKDGLWSVER